MNYLIVVSHPDDEVLGAGATIHKLSIEGETVEVCIMSGNAEARANRPETEELFSDMKVSLKNLGVSKIYLGEFPNIKLNIVPHLELVQFIENSIIESNADVVITHHPNDSNNDHYHTSIACQAAMRMFQRNPSVKPIRELLFMEVSSATEWSVNNSSNIFRPNVFIEVKKEGIAKKIEALSHYRGVMREYPHPRSSVAIEGLAAYRGSQAGIDYAESFESVFRRIV